MKLDQSTMYTFKDAKYCSAFVRQVEREGYSIYPHSWIREATKRAEWPRFMMYLHTDRTWSGGSLSLMDRRTRDIRQEYRPTIPW